MTYPHRPAQPARSPVTSPAASTWTVRRKPLAQPQSYPRRRYEISWLDRSGQMQDMVCSAPAIPVFEEAFGAFARGTLIPTSVGHIAVEDLCPGMMIETLDGDHVPLRWIGSMTVVPESMRMSGASEKLYRLTSDSFGVGHSAPDLLLGPHARYLMRNDMLKSYLGTGEALAPVSSLTDGMNVIEVSPISPVRCFHLALDRHAMIRANDVELETYHPGANTAARLPGELRAQFLALFPYIREMAEFGPMCHSRLSLGDLDHLNAA